MKAIAAERAATSATTIQMEVCRLGMPRAASTAPVRPKGSVRIECSHLIISRVVPLLRSKAKHELAGKSAEACKKFIDRQAEALAKHNGVTMRVARETIRRQCRGELLPPIALPFDDPGLAGKTVADVLADPAAFEGETLADPLEGVEYGRCKAKIMRRNDGTPWIHSFAHGRTTYELKFDAGAIRAAMAKEPAGEVVAVLVDMLLGAAVSPAEEEALTRYAKDLSGTGTRAISRQIKLAENVRLPG